MSQSRFTRRSALAAPLALAAAFATRPAAARFAERFADGVRVDVGPLLANSGEPTANWVARLLPGAIEAALAASGQAGTPIEARIDYVLLGPNSGGLGPTGSSPDQMIGEVTRGGVTQPLRATSYYYPAAADAAMIEQSNFNRVRRLSEAFAGWVARGY